MGDFIYREGRLHCEEVPLERIAEEVGTPFYCYSHAGLVSRWRAFEEAFASVDHLICYAMKANSNLAILRLFINMGGGVDIVSGASSTGRCSPGPIPRASSSPAWARAGARSPKRLAPASSCSTSRASRSLRS